MQKRYYTKEELECMTTYQLRDICIGEKLVNGMISSFDKDEYIYQILRFRGRKEHLLIQNHSAEGLKRLEHLLGYAKLSFQNKQIRGCAKVVCYENIATEVFDGFTIGYDSDLADTNALLVSGNQICAIFNIREKAENTEVLYLTKSKDIQ